MSFQNEQSAHRSVTPGKPIFADALLRQVLSGTQLGGLIVEMPDGDRLKFDGPSPGPQARVTIHRWRCLWRLLTASDLGFAESYMDGDWSSPNLVSLLKFAGLNGLLAEPTRLHRLLGLAGKVRHALNRNTRRGSRRNISAHYDLGNCFYRQWLDPGMSYSSALFSSPAQTLDEAQDAKLARVIELLEVSGAERVLEIGCGWGGLAERLLERSDCSLTGLTLSIEQLGWAERRLRERGLLDRCELRLQDYRDARGTFDRIVSIEMLEAVGEAYWPAYFSTLWDRLRPGGVAVLQVITIDECRFDDYRRRPDFIQKHIFPGGMLPTPQIIEREAANAGLRLVSEEFFGESYARTLGEWQRRFQKSWPEIEVLGFDRRFKRTWEYYLAYCRAGFECGALNVGLYKFIR